jgi:aryl-alcohol dehydrogenase-like predicted oxidoreductase
VRYGYLGKSGLRVGTMGLGTQTFGWNTGEEDAKRLLSVFFERGGTYFDTADSYNGGESERILGAWLSETSLRSRCVVGTKVFFPTGDGPNDEGAGRVHILQSVERSLARLRTDYVDLLQIHCFDRRTPLEETLRTLDDLVRAGKVRYAGVSNFAPAKLAELSVLARVSNLVPVTSLQMEYSLLVRSPEWELIPVCREKGIGMLLWSPLAGGWLTGKYRRKTAVPSDSRAGRNDRWDDSVAQRGTGHAYDVIEELCAVAEETGKPVSQVSLNWTLSRLPGAVPLIGARTEEQLKENLGTLDWSLSDTQLKRLDVVSAVPVPSPYDFIAKYTRE